MKAAVLEGVNNLIVKEVPTPIPKGDMALVRVKSCGICMTDYKAFSGERLNLKFPIICGHEFSGIIEQAGKNLKFFKEGDNVIASPVSSCGVCSDCRDGLAQYCKNGAVIGGDGMETIINGAFAEYVIVPETSLYHKPNNISFDAAALTEPLAGSYKGMIEYSQLKIGENLVIIGAGSMGLLASMIAEKAGAAKIIMIDVNDWRLNFAKNCGATHIINSNNTDPVHAVYHILPKGPDLIFEAAGPLQAAQLAFDLCRRGTRINEFGVTTEGTINISPAEMHWKETRVDASFSVYPKVMQQSIDLMESKIIDPSKIITHRYPLEEIFEGMNIMNSKERIKIIINP